MAEIYFEALHPALCRVGRKPEPALAVRPSWWDDMPYYTGAFGSEEAGFRHKQFSTIKNCPAISDGISFGYMLFSQFDFFVDATDPETLQWAGPEVSIPAYQYAEMTLMHVPGDGNYDGFPPPVGFNKNLVKISSLWSVKTEPGYSLWITNPMYRTNLPLRTIDGVLDSDKMPAVFPLNFWVRQGFAGTVKAGTPLAQIIPFKREDFTAHYGEVNLQEMEDINDVAKSRFTNAYKRLDWVRKRFK